MKKGLSITQWAEDDRPREKLTQLGKAALTDAELIAILLGTGSRDTTAVELAKQLLASCQNNLNNLAQMSLKELTRFKGIGLAKGVTLIACLELGRRRHQTPSLIIPCISTSRDAYLYIQSKLLDQPIEQFWILCLNRSNHLIRSIMISQGGVSGTIADPKIIFKKALDELASGVILIHNHPSGNMQPSKADNELTKKMVSSGQLLDIPILDHLIFTNQGYFSYADQGLL